MKRNLLPTLLSFLTIGAAPAFLPVCAQPPALDAASRANRDQRQQPDKVMDDMGLKPGMTVADIGAREGYFTFHLSRRVGPSGKVLAEDIDGESLDQLRKRMREEGLQNVSVFHGEETDTRLPAQSADLAFLSNVLCCADKPVPLLKGLHKVLKPSGRLVILQGLNNRDHTLSWVLQIIGDAGYRVTKTQTDASGAHLFICEPRT